MVTNILLKMTYKQTQKVRRIDQPLESIDVIDPASYEKKNVMLIKYRNIIDLNCSENCNDVY